MAVNGLRALSGDPALYTGTSIDPASLRTTAIEDTVWGTLMDSLNTARAALSLPATPWRNPPGHGGVAVRTQIEDLRSGVK